MLYFKRSAVRFLLSGAVRLGIRLGGYSATQAGAALLPFALIMGFGAPFAGMLSDRFGPRLSLTFGPIIAACGLALLAFADLRQSYWARSVSGDLRIRHRHDHHRSPVDLDGDVVGRRSPRRIASGVNNAVARVAGLFAVAALGAVLFASFSRHLAGTPPAQANEALNAVLAGQAVVTEGATAAFERALRTVSLLAAFCAMLGGIVGWLWIRPIGSQAAP
ncbi:hypothetical protein ACFIOY_22800 [Bradyrhizobium sp. TZ2]